jgi:NADP-dependent 3-hydroxy acid dehydrogenase YdfG
MKRNILITGATSGIGLATARLFAQHGHNLILTGRREERLQEVKKQLDFGSAIDIGVMAFDVRDSQACTQAVNLLKEREFDVDILINNAGLAKGYHSIHEGNWDDWDQMIDTNIKGLLYMTRLIAPSMVARQSGHIINVCSIAGSEVYPKGNVYCASKHAVDALTKSMRIDLHPFQIKVSQVSPGHVEETEFAKVRFDGDTTKAAIYEDFNPLTARDVADTIYFIATRPAHVNIQDVVLFGSQQANANYIDRSGRRYD